MFFRSKKQERVSGTMIYSFQTISQPSTGNYKEKGSKFMAFAYPVTTETEIRDRIDALKKEYFDARHHCFAWMLGPEKKHFRAFDDGEPNHSAGDPILGQIRASNVTNVLVVVVRYFGGVKLGVGGLISAYKIAAADALSHAVIMQLEVTAPVTLLYSYAVTPEVMRLVKDFDLDIIHQEFTDTCILKASVKLKNHAAFIEKVTLLKAMQADIRLEE